MVKGCDGPRAWQPPVYILTGEQGEGKTTFLLKMLVELSDMGVKVTGIVAPGYFHNGARSGFSIIDVATGRSEELCSKTPSRCSERHGAYYFRHAGLSFGRLALRTPTVRAADLIVVDEVGRFELEGAVWGRCIDRLVNTAHQPMIWTVRRCFVDAVAERWPGTRKIVVDIGSASPFGVIENLLEEIRVYRSTLKGGEA